MFGQASLVFRCGRVYFEFVDVVGKRRELAPAMTVHEAFSDELSRCEALDFDRSERMVDLDLC